MSKKETNVIKALLEVQQAMHVPKARRNPIGFNFRNAEDIMQAAKPVLAKVGAVVIVSDEAVSIGDRYYIKAEARFVTPDGGFSAAGYAREPDTKGKSDVSQITGASSSYARKYALCALLLIDEEEDADETNLEDKDLAYLEKLRQEIKDAFPPKVVRTAMSEYKLEKLSDLEELDFQAFKNHCGDLNALNGDKQL